MEMQKYDHFEPGNGRNWVADGGENASFAGGRMHMGALPEPGLHPSTAAHHRHREQFFRSISRVPAHVVVDPDERPIS